MSETTATIAYPSKDAAVVTCGTSATGDAAQAAEVVLFALYEGHILADIGHKPWAMNFSEALGRMGGDELAAFIDGDDVLGVRVGHGVVSAKPRVSFAAQLRRGDTIEPGFFELGDQNDWRLKARVCGSLG